VVERVGVGGIRIGGTMPKDDHVAAGAQAAHEFKITFKIIWRRLPAGWTA
jgi:hypothetical protein